MIALIAALVLTRLPPSCNELDGMHQLVNYKIEQGVAWLREHDQPRDDDYDTQELELLKLIGIRDDVESLQKKQNCP